MKEKFSLAVVERLKEALKLDSDADLAHHFDIEPYNIRDWKRDDTIKYRLIIDKVKGVNLHWLFTGEGPMMTDPKKEPQFTHDEKELIGLYRRASSDVKTTVEVVLRSNVTATASVAESSPRYGKGKKTGGAA